MARQKITALPSMVIMPDKSIRALDSFSPQERKEWQNRLWKRVENAINEIINTNDEEAERIKKALDLLEQAEN